MTGLRHRAQKTKLRKMSNEVPATAQAHRYQPIDMQPAYAYLTAPAQRTEKSTTQPAMVTAATEEENLSIEAKEKELITKALARFKHKRKQAAQVLGISERTLYRKINEYKLE